MKEESRKLISLYLFFSLLRVSISRYTYHYYVHSLKELNLKKKKIKYREWVNEWVREREKNYIFTTNDHHETTIKEKVERGQENFSNFHRFPHPSHFRLRGKIPAKWNRSGVQRSTLRSTFDKAFDEFQPRLKRALFLRFIDAPFGLSAQE